jgi:3-oxoacyl-(acyl-carrier-protein) synthase
MYQRRVVITGLGVLAPNGSGKEAFWQACLQGRSGIRAIKCFDASDLTTRFAGNIADFVPEEFGLTEGECARLDRSSQFASVAASLALDDAGLRCEDLSVADRESMGVYMGTAIPSLEGGPPSTLSFARSRSSGIFVKL